ncbi:MAG: D-alanyl-D-alanine carboxypeptidase family protein [Clostridia bacterium]
MSKNKSRKKGYKNINTAAIVTCFAVILIISAVIIFNYVLKNDEPNVSDLSSQNNSLTLSETSSREQNEPISEEQSKPLILEFEKISMDSKQIHRGNLIVVNNENQYVFEPSESLIKISDEKTANYKMGDLTLTLSKSIMKDLNDMLDALSKEVSSKSLTISSGFRTYEQQNKIYNSAKDKTKTMKPGGSDLHTGLSFSAWVYPSNEGKISSGKFAWLDENCKNYGFIVRYPANKAAITGYDPKNDSSTTYRYVGNVHAHLISLNNYCLEEYIEFVKRFSYNNYYTISYNEKDYAIYYCLSSGDATTISVPKGCKYTISGDNIGGFIVTAELSQ